MPATPHTAQTDAPPGGAAPAGGSRRGLMTAGVVTGVALGGFFDGIVLHQILQWHHFLSLVPGEALRDLRNQVIADGAFHVLMYGIAALGLWLLWRARAGLAAEGSGRTLAGAVLLGFGAWQFVDVGVFHWLLGIHRIRVDVPDPLLWDVGWLVVVGLPPTLAGAALLARRGEGGGGGAGRESGGRAGAASLAALVLALGPLAALPPVEPAGAERPVLVLFREGTGAPASFAAVAAVDGRVAWADASGELLAVVPPPGGSLWGLYRRGALAVGGGLGGAGCLGWTRAPQRAAGSAASLQPARASRAG